MADKRMMIVPAALIKKIDENRGEMSQAEFIELLIDTQLKEEDKEQKYVTKNEILSFEQDMKQLLKHFLDFFVSYGLELGKNSPEAELEKLMQGLQKGLSAGGEKGKATIKWK